MKARNGFVSNSSSSSFIVKKSNLSELQCAMVDNWDEAIRTNLTQEQKNGCRWVYGEKYRRFGWTVDEIEGGWEFWTSMDNFDLEKAFVYLGIPVENTDKNTDRW